MLRVYNMNYSASAESVDDQNDSVIASMHSNCDNTGHYSFTLNFSDMDNICSQKVLADFADFLSQVKDVCTSDMMVDNTIPESTIEGME